MTRNRLASRSNHSALVLQSRSPAAPQSSLYRWTACPFELQPWIRGLALSNLEQLGRLIESPPERACEYLSARRSSASRFLAVPRHSRLHESPFHSRPSFL